MLTEGVGRLSLVALGSVSIVLDASESAEGYQEAILELAGKISEQLPAEIGRKFYFLSNHNGYDFTDLSRNFAGSWRENNARGSFLTPLLQSVDTSKIVVIGSGTIYDLEDWQGTDAASNVILIKVGRESLQGEAGVGEELDNPDFSDVLSRLREQILKIEITGKGFMPFFWDNLEYKHSVGEKVALTAVNPQNPALSLAFYGRDVRARVWYASGQRERLIEPFHFEVVDRWKSLSEDEAEAFRRVIQGKAFTCPTCGHEHPPETLLCKVKGFILDKPVYPSLEQTKGLVVFRETDRSVIWRNATVDIVRVRPEFVAIREGRTAKLYSYNISRETWDTVCEVKPYQLVGDEYVLVI